MGEIMIFNLFNDFQGLRCVEPLGSLDRRSEHAPIFLRQKKRRWGGAKQEHHSAKQQNINQESSAGCDAKISLRLSRNVRHYD